MESTSIIHGINKHQECYSIIDNIASLIATFKRYALVFQPWQKGPQGGCIGPLKKNLWNGLWNIENFAKMRFFQKVTPNFFFISDL